MAIVENEIRVGRFTSSQVHVLMKGGKSKDAVFSVAGLTISNRNTTSAS